MKTTLTKRNDLTKQIYLLRNKMEEEKEKLETGMNRLSLQSKTISDIDMELVSLKSRKNEETELEEGYVMFLQGLETMQKFQKDTLEKKDGYVEVEAENLEILNSNLKTSKRRIAELKAGYFDRFFHCFIYLFLVF